MNPFVKYFCHIIKLKNCKKMNAKNNKKNDEEKITRKPPKYPRNQFKASGIKSVTSLIKNVSQR